MLKWARNHGCEWNAETSHYAALTGQLDVLRWAREHHCECENVCVGRSARAPGGVAVGAGAPLPVGLEDVCNRR